MRRELGARELSPTGIEYRSSTCSYNEAVRIRPLGSSWVRIPPLLSPALPDPYGTRVLSTPLGACAPKSGRFRHSRGTAHLSLSQHRSFSICRLSYAPSPAASYVDTGNRCEREIRRIYTLMLPAGGYSNGREEP